MDLDVAQLGLAPLAGALRAGDRLPVLRDGALAAALGDQVRATCPDSG